MAGITKDSRIVEVFSADLTKKEVNKSELKDANDFVKELASNPSPENMYELSQIMSYVINDGFQERVNYLNEVADVKRTGFGEKAQFQLEIDGLKAMFQAKSATTERSKVSTKYLTLDTEEVSVRPVVNFYDLQTGKTNLVRLAQQAAAKMDVAVAKRIQDSVYAAFSALSTPNYATGNGIVKSTFDPILRAMQRAGGLASIMGDIEALAKFTELTGFSNVADALAIEHNENGMIGRYGGASLVKLNNPFQPNSVSATELRKDLVYVIPTGDAELRPIKVHFEGDVHAIMPDMNINSKAVEFRFDQYVGTGVAGIRKLLGVYEDTSL